MSGIDLHVHSTASDGWYAPRDVVRRAAERGLRVIALVDHDTLDGLEEARAAGAEHGVRVVPGCEFSVAAPWGEVHVLGYFLSATARVVSAFLEVQRAQRRERAEEIVDRLRGLGSGVALDHVLAEVGDGAVGRPHVARA
ncbi:MAG: PHP domain-containing protein, partial [Gemmatimonadales bacterium]